MSDLHFHSCLAATVLQFLNSAQVMDPAVALEGTEQEGYHGVQSAYIPSANRKCILRGQLTELESGAAALHSHALQWHGPITQK
jgi:hypothetical protein